MSVIAPPGRTDLRPERTTLICPSNLLAREKVQSSSISSAHGLKRAALPVQMISSTVPSRPNSAAIEFGSEMSTRSSELRDARMRLLSPSALTISLPISPARPNHQYLAQSLLLYGSPVSRTPNAWIEVPAQLWG